jgi:organic radical activating enzyme
MEYDITLVVTTLIGMGLGIGLVALYVWFVIQRFHSNLDEMVKETLEEVRASLVGLIIEEDGDQLYAYRETDRQFLCQGVNIAEIRKKFSEQYPDKTAYLSGGDPALIERLKAELAQIKEQENSQGNAGV